MVLALFLSGPAHCAPSVVLDGSFGSAGALAGPNYIITAGMGRQVGANLFQSFSSFNLNSSESATFTGTGSTGPITNILARVTGGASSIDGTINSTISGANLFLLNPAGVMFGANAQVNVTGAFVVSTASYAKLSDGNIFYADINHPISDQGLTSAPVSAFGFLSATPQPVSFEGSVIRQPVGDGLHVIGGDITVDNALLLAPGGDLTLFSAASAGEVPFSLASPGTGFANATNTSFGSINVTNGSKVEIDYRGGGSVTIRGGHLTVDASDITSGNYGSIPGGSISVQVAALTLNNEGFIAAVSETIDDAGSNTGNLPIITGDTGSADAGSVNVSVSGNTEITGNGSGIDSDTDTAGSAGTVNFISSGQVNLDNVGSIIASSTGSGDAGAVNIQALALTMTSTAAIGTFAQAGGNAGQISLKLKGPLMMTGNANIDASNINGNRGNILIVADSVSLTDKAQITANSFGSGPGGSIDIEAGTLSVVGDGSNILTEIATQSLNSGQGAAGMITVNSTTVSLSQGGSILSNTVFGSGDGGVVDISTNKLSLSSGGTISVAARAIGGSILINCSEGSLSGQSTIDASSLFRNGGAIQIDASNNLELTGNSSVTSSAGENSGNITLKINQLLYLSYSNIEAFGGVAFEATGPLAHPGGNGGNILIDPEFVVLDNSLISANNLSGVGQDGNIVNDANFFFTSDSILHATGTIQTTAPDLNLAQSLAFLPANLVSAATQLRERCDRAANHEFSSLIVVGRGGIENAPDEVRPDFGFDPSSGGTGYH